METNGRFPYLSPVRNSPGFDEDYLIAEQCLSGDAAAVERLRTLCTDGLRVFLASRGGNASESEALAQTLFVDCLAATNGRTPLLATYRGECPLRPWLARVALNRLISLKRAAQRELARFGTEGDAALETFPSAAAHTAEEPVLALVHAAISGAFAECEAEHFVMLHLLHASGLKQEELARMFGCSIATVSRKAESARDQVRSKIMTNVRRADPWLELTWDDLLAVCRTAVPECLGAL